MGFFDLVGMSSPEGDFERGYNYAKEALRKGITEDVLESQASGWDGPDSFDRGISAALREIPMKEEPCTTTK